MHIYIYIILSYRLAPTVRFSKMDAITFIYNSQPPTSSIVFFWLWYLHISIATYSFDLQALYLQPIYAYAFGLQFIYITMYFEIRVPAIASGLSGP